MFENIDIITPTLMTAKQKEVNIMDPNWWMFGGYMLEQDRLEEENDGYYESPGSSLAGWVVVGIIFFVLIILLRVF